MVRLLNGKRDAWIHIAAPRESEHPEDCGVKLRGIQTIFFNRCLPVTSRFAATDSIDSWISESVLTPLALLRVKIQTQHTHRSATVFRVWRNLRNRKPRTLSALAIWVWGMFARPRSPRLAGPRVPSN